MKTITQTPIQVCFNCALLMHPHSDNVLKLPLAATSIRAPADCRGYRVAKHYIDELVTRVVGDGGGDDSGDGDGNDAEHATRDSVFRCCQSSDGLHMEVFSCAACKHERAQQPSHNLFDGVAADGSYTSCGVGDPQPEALAALTVHERLALSVLQMADASFSAYAGYGYMHYNGGAILTANDYTGNAALLMRNTQGDDTNASRGRLVVDEQRLRAALDHLRDPTHGNPLVLSLLTCLERELLSEPHDQADSSASNAASGMPMLSEADANADANANDVSQADTDEPQASVPVADVTLAPVARQLNQQTFGGVFQGVDDVDAASVAQRNGVHRQVLGSTQARGAQASISAPVISRDVAASTDALLHTTLYPTGRGGHVRGDENLREGKHRTLACTARLSRAVGPPYLRGLCFGLHSSLSARPCSDVLRVLLVGFTSRSDRSLSALLVCSAGPQVLGRPTAAQLVLPTCQRGDKHGTSCKHPDGAYRRGGWQAARCCERGASSQADARRGAEWQQQGQG